jgi:hypothetical protein
MIGAPAGFLAGGRALCSLGIGLPRRLPALRPVLVVLGCGYTLWGLRVVPLIGLELQHAGTVPHRFFVIRGAPLCRAWCAGWALPRCGRNPRPSRRHVPQPGDEAVHWPKAQRCPVDRT